MFETYLDLVSNLTESHNCQSFDRWVWSSAAKRATLIAITHHEHRQPHQYDDEEEKEREHLSLFSLCQGSACFILLVTAWWFLFDLEWLSIPINHGTPSHQNHHQQHQDPFKKWP